MRVNWACNGTGCPSSLGELWSFYEDRNHNLYALAANGILRVTKRSVCFGSAEGVAVTSTIASASAAASTVLYLIPHSWICTSLIHSYSTGNSAASGTTSNALTSDTASTALHISLLAVIVLHVSLCR